MLGDYWLDCGSCVSPTSAGCGNVADGCDSVLVCDKSAGGKRCFHDIDENTQKVKNACNPSPLCTKQPVEECR